MIQGPYVGYPKIVALDLIIDIDHFLRQTTQLYFDKNISKTGLWRHNMIEAYNSIFVGDWKMSLAIYQKMRQKYCRLIEKHCVCVLRGEINQWKLARNCIRDIMIPYEHFIKNLDWYLKWLKWKQSWKLEMRPTIICVLVIM